MGPKEIHPRVPRDLAAVIAGTLFVAFQWSWESGEIPVSWKLANVVPIFKKGKKEDPSDSRPVSLTAVPGELWRRLFWELLKMLEKQGSLWSSPAWIHEGKVLLNPLGFLL